jgi:hypothetical protein
MANWREILNLRITGSNRGWPISTSGLDFGQRRPS